MNGIAEAYVKLVLAVGKHDANYVDAFYGPAEWKQAAEAAGKRPLPELLGEARYLLAALADLLPADAAVLTGDLSSSLRPRSRSRYRTDRSTPGRRRRFGQAGSWGSSVCRSR